MPTRVPGIIEADAKDAPLFVRGEHKQLAELVPRRFLDALDPTPFNTKSSGRLELAERMADMKNNPLTARVIVNRVWHHVFGRGIVASVDNFGKLGDLPTHPELLDFLAQRFIASGGSIKSLLRDILLSKTFQRSAGSNAKDPENKLLAHWSIRRLEAEAIRDSIVTLSGRLDPTLYGESADHGDPRRSIYIKVIRNSLNPFLTTFDAPVPFSTRGKRDATNVPAQSLALLNDARVIDWSRGWAQRTLERGPPSPQHSDNTSNSEDAERVRQMFREAFAREASDDEVKQSLAYLAVLQRESTKQARELAEQEEKITALNRQITAILDPARTRLQAERKLPAAPVNTPEPLAEWTFDKDGNDLKGRMNLSTRRRCPHRKRRAHGRWQIHGRKRFAAEKTAQGQDARSLGHARQPHPTRRRCHHRAGKDGGVFDSIVFAEKTPAHWVAGSDHFNRSELFEASAETEAATRPVHLAVVYQADGTITGYRDGKPYGRTYRKAPGAVFEPEVSQVLLGCRHGSPAGNKGLSGRIFRARLYDRALNAEEISQTARIESSTITEADILATLISDQRTQLKKLQGQRDQLTQSLDSARIKTSSDTPELQAWTSLAQSLINLKEFIYLK
jgi:hypothetical protein